ncbi:MULTISPECIES: DUF1684 domain-containing protein [unclassified Streptomyces]|uniref:DUF1684 domain-containing protein n=1 Tax=unclassified Streptomyces TaxID=2593676 RepID=UPI0016607817|nr:MULTISPECIES: DUF1684 domain-containing protein [unclassified Streptomyces]MBD0707839.1 hypothetical protein [Streptomyces sp. CBMA291]MBD0717253.1 hypothetical protein [Streptomyces sp. CBMA370]
MSIGNAPAPHTTDHPDDTAEVPEGFVAAWKEWHRAKEARLAGPHGFLAITGLTWLTDEPQPVPDAPGTWTTGPGGPVVELAEGEELLVDGEPVTGRYAFGEIPERGSVDAVWGDAVIEVARRGGHDVIRPRHPGHPLRTAYAGTPVYAPHPRWAVTGRYVPFAEPRPTTVGASVEGIQHVYEAPGRVEFRLEGKEFSLTAFNGSTPGALTVLFTDATSGLTTYAANRTLRVDLPGPDGTVLLDFNRAANLPCAYTDFATCPLPPAENRLPVAVEAGEKIPLERGAVTA